MLKTLSIWNFALIEYEQINFQKGLNILSGETGAGKSILLNALGLILGNRTNLDNLRYGADFIRVEAIFDLEEDNHIKEFLKENNIINEDNTIIITRQINKNGKNSIQVNNCHITLNLLKNLGNFLVNIHSQHANSDIIKEDYHLKIIDLYLKDEIDKIKEEYLKEFLVYKKLLEEFNNTQKNSQDLIQRLDLLNWQIKEIELANLKENEDTSLEEELKILSNSETISDLVNEACSYFEDDNITGYGITTSLNKLKNTLEDLANYNEELNNLFKIVEDAYYQMDSVETDLKEVLYSMDYSPQRLDEIQNRLNEIDKLKYKYGQNINEILAFLEKIKLEKDELENYDLNINKLQSKLTKQKTILEKLAQKLHALRQKSKEGFLKSLISELNLLGMNNPKVEYKLILEDDYTKNGADKLNVLFSANPGEDLKPIEKTASGGELSRIALSIKSIISLKDDLKTIVFDEVDTGVGGKTAFMMAEKIMKIANNRQVICITHLPQIAVMADVHFYINKFSENEKTYTTIKELNKQEEVKEIARMLAGDIATKSSLENAKELKEYANNFKENLN